MTPPAPPTDLARDADALVARLVAAYPARGRSRDGARRPCARAASTSSASTPTTTRASCSRSPSTSGSAIACVPDRRPARRRSRSRRRASAAASTSTRSAPRRGAWIDYVAGTAWALAEAGVPVARVPGGPRVGPAAGIGAVVARRRSSWRRPSRCPAATLPAVDRMTLARLAQRAENEYVGVELRADGPVRVGVRRAGHALLLDCRSLEHRAVPLPARRVGAGRVPLGLAAPARRLAPTTSGARSARPRSRRIARASPG